MEFLNDEIVQRWLLFIVVVFGGFWSSFAADIVNRELKVKTKAEVPFIRTLSIPYHFISTLVPKKEG